MKSLTEEYKKKIKRAIHLSPIMEIECAIFGKGYGTNIPESDQTVLFQEYDLLYDIESQRMAIIEWAREKSKGLTGLRENEIDFKMVYQNNLSFEDTLKEIVEKREALNKRDILVSTCNSLSDNPLLGVHFLTKDSEREPYIEKFKKQIDEINEQLLEENLSTLSRGKKIFKKILKKY